MTPDRDDPARERDATGDARTVPEPDDAGKDVVDVRGEEIGVVTEVEGDTMHVDPHPSVTQRIKSILGIGGGSDEALPVSPELVERIEDDVVLDVTRDEEFQDEG